jgi:Uma2 family endonuclease
MASPVVPSEYLLAYDDWYRIADEGKLCELIDGELFMSPTPSIGHQRASRELLVAIESYLRRASNGEVFHAPTGVRLGDKTVLEPDLLVVLNEHASRVGEQVVVGAPDLVVEILSPGTARRDLGIKRDKYRDTGVPEYWIVDALNTSIEVLVLERGAYVRFGLFQRGDVLRSRVLPGFEVPVTDVFPAL